MVHLQNKIAIKKNEADLYTDREWFLRYITAQKIIKGQSHLYRSYL